MDNEKIYCIKRIVKTIKNIGLVVFTFHLFSLELNKIENTIGRL